jgi:sulfur relay (sulfurtransferase) DsrF/TusC family protein
MKVIWWVMGGAPNGQKQRRDGLNVAMLRYGFTGKMPTIDFRGDGELMELSYFE